MTLITTNAALADACAQLAHEPYITVDTEFARERYYYPRLCMVQIAGTCGTFLVDTLAVDDLTPFWNLMAAPDVLKVFHSCRQDLEVIYQAAKIFPAPLFDTQVACLFLGFHDSVGYERLIAKYLNVNIDKSSQFSDWERRPLSQKQIDYARDDVRHLFAVYPMIRDELERLGRYTWAVQETMRLFDPALYEPKPETAWMRLRPPTRDRRYLERLHRLAAWREDTAQRANLPRQHILKDDGLYIIAEHNPQKMGSLKRIHRLNEAFVEQYGDQVLEALAIAAATPHDQCPTADMPRQLDRRQEQLLDLLKLLLKACAARAEVAPSLLSTSDDLQRLVTGNGQRPECLSGWRHGLFGKDAEALLQGRLAARIQRGQVVFFGIEPEDPA